MLTEVIFAIHHVLLLYMQNLFNNESGKNMQIRKL